MKFLYLIFNYFTNSVSFQAEYKKACGLSLIEINVIILDYFSGHYYIPAGELL